MKVGIIGVGAVGSACALALMQRGSAREIVLVDKTRARVRAVALDMGYGAPVSPKVDVRDGSYGDLKGADLVMGLSYWINGFWLAPLKASQLWPAGTMLADTQGPQLNPTAWSLIIDRGDRGEISD